MPLYEYSCGGCGHHDTLLEKISAAKTKKCPACGKAKSFKRQLSAAAFHLKGSGWYATDFKDQPKKKASKETTESKPDKETPKSKDNTASKSETKSDKSSTESKTPKTD